MSINRQMPSYSDRKTGVYPVATFPVQLTWTNINAERALLEPLIEIDDELYSLSQPVEVLRVYRELSTGRVEGAGLVAVACMKMALSAGGVTVLDMVDDSPACFKRDDTTQVFRWIATVGSRLSIAIVKLSSGQVRLSRVE